MADSDFNPAREGKDMARWFRDQARAAASWETKFNQSAEIWEVASELGTPPSGVEGPPIDIDPLRDLYLSGSQLAVQFNEQRPFIDQVVSGLTGNSTTYAATMSSLYIETYGINGATTVDWKLLGQLEEAVARDLNDPGVLEKLRRIDEALVPLYQQTVLDLYGSGPDSLRNALFHTRQLWDHLLFDRLSPTAEVEAKFGLAQRPQRLEYVLESRVAAPLRDSFRQTLKRDESVYNDLQYLHKRGVLREDAARAKVKEGLTVLLKWLDGVS